jgi:hypothetical protein
LQWLANEEVMALVGVAGGLAVLGPLIRNMLPDWDGAPATVLSILANGCSVGSKPVIIDYRGFVIECSQTVSDGHTVLTVRFAPKQE